MFGTGLVPLIRSSPDVRHKVCAAYPATSGCSAQALCRLSGHLRIFRTRVVEAEFPASGAAVVWSSQGRGWYLTGFLIPSGTPRGEASTVALAGRSAPVVPAAVGGGHHRRDGEAH